MREHRFPHDEGCHFRIRLIVQQAVQRMVGCFPVAVFLFLIHPEGQRGDRFRDDADAGVNGRHLYGVPGIDRFAGRACAEVEGRRAGNGILGFVAGAEKKLKWVFHQY